VLVELGEGAGELAVVAHFRHLEGGAMAGFPMQREIAKAALGGGSLGRGCRCGGRERHAAGFRSDARAFKTEEPEITPLGDDHFLDEHAFDGSDGLEFGEEGVDDFTEALARFAGEEERFGEESSASRRDGPGGVDRAAGAGRGIWRH